MFAVDTTIFVNVNPASAAFQVNDDLQSINDWASTWLASFSPAKTKSMLVSLRRNIQDHPPLYFGNSELTTADSHRHLGITISNDLKWDKHIPNIIKKSGTEVDVLSRLLYKSDRQSLERLCTAFVRPSLEYGDVLL